MKFLFLLSFVSSLVFADEKKWLGEWIAFDEWKSQYIIKLEKNYEASSNYADGQEGTWAFKDGNILIEWNNGKTDFIFNGVMGLQRLHKSKKSSYTSGIKKKSSN